MTRRLAVLAASLIAVAVLAACDAPLDEDRCVPPNPSPTGAPWAEWDDGEPCRPDGAGGWENVPEDDDHEGRIGTTRTTKRTTTRPARTTRATPTRATRTARQRTP